MPEGPFPDRGPDGQEPDGSQPQPADRNGPENRGPTPSGDQGSDATLSATPPEEHDAPPEEPTQGLFICLPAEQADLSGFADGSSTHPIAPGPLLAEVVSAVAGGGGAGLAQISEDCLFSVLSAGRRMSSWGTWLELAAMRELAVRHPYTPDRRASRGRTPKTSGTPAQDPPGVQDRPASQDQPAAPKPAGATQDPAGATQDPAGAGAGPGGAPVGPNQPADDGRIQFSEFISDEVACELRLTWMAAEDRMSYACDLAGRLPVTFAALGAGLIDPVHAKIIAEQTHFLSAADAAKADPLLAAAAQKKTYAELRAAAAKLVLTLDPESAERRKQARRKNDAHVRPFREESGNAGMIARELPSDEVLASWQHVEQRARELRAAGVPGSLRELRVRSYLDLLQERDSRLVAGPAPDQGHNPPDATGSNGVPSDGPDGQEEPEGHEGSEEPEGPEGPDGNGGPQDGSGGNGPGPHRPAGPGAGPCLAALVNLTVPLATALGQSGTPGEAAGFGLLDAGTARDLIAAAGRSPYTRWCVTVLHPDGTAAAHGCAAGRHPPPPGPEPPGPEPPGPEPPGPEPPGPEPPGPELPASPSPGGASRAAPAPPGPAPPGTAGLGTSRDTSGSPDPQPQPDTRARDYLRTLRVRLTPIARGSCDHKHAETGYQPSRKLQHLIRTRNTRCTAPGCGRPAARCDLDHTLAWDKGGLTCECGVAPLCRHHHRCKQAQGWQLTQPEPGVLQWRSPHGRTFATTPTEYSQ
jgi:hypothetical protein